MTFESVLMMLGGIGMFLYGMKLMGSSLESAAGAKMEKILEKLTSNKAKGVALGAGVTAVIQSSAATIIMVVGFLNAGILKLAQGVPVIMGANIGTTITAQILRMGDISGDNILLVLLKPSTFAPLLIVVSAFIMLMSKRQSVKDKTGIFMGLGILFMGMTLMQNSFAPLAESEEFSKIFTLFANPFLGVAVGMMVTILLQSSSAAVGVLQATASTGVVTFAMAAPITIGCNLGKCVTVLLASIGVNRDAKRAVSIDVTMCVLGSVLFLIVIYLYQGIIGFNFWDDTVNMGGVANFHTLFNVVVAIVFLPFINPLIKLAGQLVKDKSEYTKMDQELAMLDPRFFDTPNVALEQCRKVINIMCDTGRDSFNIACDLVNEYDEDKRQIVNDNEAFLDKTETVLGEYIVHITEHPLSARQNVFATELLHTVGDMERIGDHIDNIAEESEIMHHDGIKYSDESMVEFGYLRGAINEILETTSKAYEAEDASLVLKVEALEEIIDDMVDAMKINHATRLKEGTCTVERGVSFIEMLTDIERISDHCNNVCQHLLQRLNGWELSTHDRTHDNEEERQAYEALYEEYRAKYLQPIT
ncbi:MAG: Na/Pi cotransporter family protein [Clostridia bacterium]|nr:Na/Pi cotransporter family protein [Clostridia bacterium]